ncbi:hypothetical protein ACQEUU_18890 [Nonomuraea sp. CA-218870]|uniref:hypothetical protein n=1 Tax=Nonomuraea sp. CA-218870 TaxID=3239998 RepID=UPI003D8EE298
MYVTVALLASPEGVAMARGFLYLVAVLAVWTVVAAVRHFSKAVTALFRATLLVVTLTGVGAVAVAVIAQLALILQLT